MQTLLNEYSLVCHAIYGDFDIAVILGFRTY